MSALVNAHSNALRRAFNQLRAQPVGTLLSLVVLGCALAIPLVIYLLLGSLGSATTRVNADAEVNVFADPKLSLEDARALQAKLAALPGVAAARLVPKDQALAQLKQRPQLADLVASLDNNPLPHAVVVRAAEASPENLERLRVAALALPGVDKVSADFEWLRKLGRLMRLGEGLLLGLALLLAAAVVLVIGNTIRLEVLARRDEIQVSQLIGASRAFVRRPFLYFGLIAGGLAGCLGWLLATVGIWWANSHIQGLAADFGLSFRIMQSSPKEAVTYILVIAFLALVGALFSANALAWKSASRS